MVCSGVAWSPYMVVCCCALFAWQSSHHVGMLSVKKLGTKFALSLCLDEVWLVLATTAPGPPLTARAHLAVTTGCSDRKQKRVDER